MAQLRQRACLASALALCVLGAAGAALALSPTPTIAAEQTRSEIVRGASSVAEIIAKRYPYPTTYRLIRGRLERNVHEHRDSDGFSLGAHLATAFWLEGLPPDVSWRERALARHRDVTTWILARIGLSAAEVARLTAAGERLPADAATQLLEFVEALPLPR